MSDKAKNVQVPYKYLVSVIALIWKLEGYQFDKDTQDLIDYLSTESNNKVDRMVNRELYSKAKNPNISEEERKQALNEYLDSVGFHPDWRY